MITMKNSKSVIFFSAVTMMALSGCSLFSGKKDTTVTNRAPSSVVEDGAEATEAKGDVLDGGVYRENEDYSDVKVRGGMMADAVPTENFYSVDREKHAPVGKVMYVVTDDNPTHCLVGKFTQVHGRKKLIVYTKSPVPNNYCLYQKTAEAEPQGFSIYADKGGVCKPTYMTVDHVNSRNIASVAGFDKTVSMTYCTENTVSWGETHRKH